ncbi:acyl--CoA ligase [Nonomuraea sp. NN258]|uniref:class I adenylate-forming enzyme family protein n=1 Tax=Nonomuraea antri TaxID=2730852 RepID=UPI0015696E5D|nr:class I adenylate-forming enzyme family protein [Nonomuraea antri]NRQ33092.1 acyl--CoA ligase [Nonomuraea antri]
MTTRRTDLGLAHTYRDMPYGPPWAVPGSVISRLTGHARTRGGAPFLTSIGPDGEESTLTYAEADELSARVAGWLCRDVGVSPGDTLALLPLNEPRSILAVLALLRLRCPVLLLNPADPPARLREQITAIGARTVLRAAAASSSVLPEAIVLPVPSRLPETPLPAPRAPEDPAADALYFGTSGSTASAKLVAQSHYNAIVNAVGVGLHHGLRPGDRILGCLPVHHVNGLHLTVLGALVAGAHLVQARAFDPFAYPDLLRRHRPRIAGVVPSLLDGLVRVWHGPPPPPGFEYFVSAAAPLAAGTARDVRDRLGARVLQGYGLTETTNFSTTMPRDLSETAYDRFLLNADIPSIGVAIPGNEVAVLREDGSRAEPGETGELCMRGHNVMNGYAGNPEATAEAFRGGWFHSQDLGFEQVDADTGYRFFHITGRTKNIAKVGGETVSLEEMERALRAAPGVRDAACACVPRRFVGDEIVAAVVLDRGEWPDLRAGLRAHLLTAFAEAVVPRRFEVLDAIPRTPTGKILRPRLRSLLSGPAE